MNKRIRAISENHSTKVSSSSPLLPSHLDDDHDNDDDLKPKKKTRTEKSKGEKLQEVLVLVVKMLDEQAKRMSDEMVSIKRQEADIKKKLRELPQA